MSLAIPAALRPALAQPVAVFGEGVSGQGVLALLRVLGLPGVTYDERGTGFTAERASGHALVVFSPGFAANHPWIQLAQAAGLECLGEIDFAVQFWKGRVIAITGTNGKTTLTEFLTHAQRQEWEVAHAVGNIGRPLARLVADTAGGTADDLAVCEVSSFQAETMRHFRAEAVLWTNFAEDHLDRHADLRAYFEAKWRLVTTAAPQLVVLGASVARHARELGIDPGGATVVDTEGQASDPELHDTVFSAYPQRENFIVALAWWRAVKRPPAKLYAAARSFRLGRHRLAKIEGHGGATWWNDSKGTNFHAVEGALRGFERPVHLILGGKRKGGDVAAFVARIAPRVAHAYLIGEAAPALAEACATAGVAHTASGTLMAAVTAAASVTHPRDHILLSPGFASFDQFRNYEERGETFERLVQELGNPAAIR